MSFTLDNLVQDGEIAVVLRIDSALDMTPEEYEEYLDSGLDESKLKLKSGEEPTKFIMSKQVPFKHAAAIEDKKVKFNADGDMDIQMGWHLYEVRATLKKIVNPPSVPQEKAIVLKFTGDGLIDEKQMAAFLASGIVGQLFNARQRYIKHTTAKGADLVKKS